MRNDYEEFSFEKDVTKASDGGRQVGEAFGTALLNGIRGLADWIGLGDTFASWFEKPDFDVEKIKSQLVTRINKLINENQINYDRLQQKLDDLATMGYSLTGIARRKVNEASTKMHKQIKQAQIEKAKNEVNFNSMLNDAERLKTWAENSDITWQRKQKDLAQHLEKAIGEYDNVQKNNETEG